VAEITDDDGNLRLVLALPCWDDYLRIALDDLIESGSRSPIALFRARAMLSSLLDVAPPQRKPSIAWRLRRAEELAAGNFPVLWRNTSGSDAG
jgi:hypothetical protein